MKGLARALLGTVAWVGAAGLASADELSALKAELEALQSRVSQLEAQRQASLPTGSSLVSMRDGQCYFEEPRTEKRDDMIPPELGYTFSVLPTADAAPAAEVFVTAETRTALLYTDFEQDDNLDVATRARVV